MLSTNHQRAHFSLHEHDVVAICLDDTNVSKLFTALSWDAMGLVMRRAVARSAVGFDMLEVLDKRTDERVVHKDIYLSRNATPPRLDPNMEVTRVLPHDAQPDQARLVLRG
jgi:hypothetical protein